MAEILLCYLQPLCFTDTCISLLDNGNICLRLQMVYVCVCQNVVSTVEIRQERGSAQSWTFDCYTIVYYSLSKALPRFCVWNETMFLTMFRFLHSHESRCLQSLSIADSDLWFAFIWSCIRERVHVPSHSLVMLASTACRTSWSTSPSTMASASISSVWVSVLCRAPFFLGAKLTICFSVCHTPCEHILILSCDPLTKYWCTAGEQLQELEIWFYTYPDFMCWLEISNLK